MFTMKGLITTYIDIITFFTLPMFHYETIFGSHRMIYFVQTMISINIYEFQCLCPMERDSSYTQEKPYQLKM